MTYIRVFSLPVNGLSLSFFFPSDFQSSPKHLIFETLQRIWWLNLLIKGWEFDGTEVWQWNQPISLMKKIIINLEAPPPLFFSFSFFLGGGGGLFSSHLFSSFWWLEFCRLWHWQKTDQTIIGWALPAASHPCKQPSKMSGEGDCSSRLSQAQWQCGACLTAQAGVCLLGCCSSANNEPFWGCQNCQTLTRYPANFKLFYSIAILSLIMNLFEGVESDKILLSWWVTKRIHNIYP